MSSIQRQICPTGPVAKGPSQLSLRTAKCGGQLSELSGGGGAVARSTQAQSRHLFFYLSPLSFPRLSLSLSPSNTQTRDSSVGSVLPSRPEQLHHLSLLPRLIQELVSSYIVLISRCKCMNYTLPSQFLYFPSAFAIFFVPLLLLLPGRLLSLHPSL